MLETTNISGGNFVRLTRANTPLRASKCFDERPREKKSEVKRGE